MINQKIKNNHLKYKKSKINSENIIRSNMSSLFYNNLDLFSFFNFLNLDSVKLLTILKYLCINKKHKLLKEDDLINVLSNISINKELNISELNLVIQNFANKTFTKFKSPVITLDIILFSFLSNDAKEEKLKYKSNIICYKLLQNIYRFNSRLKGINKNDQIFIYLLISQISEIELEQLYLSKKINLIIFIFRNLIFLDIKFLDLKNNSNKQLNKLLVRRKY